MSNSVKLTGKKLESFLSKLSELIDTLPSQETKSRLDQEVETFIKFLQDFRIRLRSLPTGEDADGVTSTIETIKDYVRIAESDPVMSRVLGLSSDNRAWKPSHKSLTEQGRKDAKAVAEELKRLSLGDVERKLADKRKYNTPMLRQIARELRVNISSKSTRLSIIEKIAKKTANLRGYESLRHGHHESVSGYGSETEGESSEKRRKQDEITSLSAAGSNVRDGS